MPDTSEPDQISRLLAGGARADELLAAVYDELRVLAARRMAEERNEHTLQATALVNEVYLRLSRDRNLAWRDRSHFFGAAAEAMRRVLVDHARRVRSAKRGGDQARLDLTLSGLSDTDDPEMLLALNDAVECLEREDPRSAGVARLRLFAGLSSEDVGLALELAPRTVQRDWAYARARLSQLLGAQS